MTIQPKDHATDRMMFAARHLSVADRWDRAQHFIQQIIELERATDPAGGVATQDGKDSRARAALELAGQLVRVVAGWAVDHVVGVAAEAAAGTKSSSPDDHAHEARGWISEVEDANADTVGRAVLKQLIICNPGAIPESLRRLAVEAFEALEHDEVLPLVTPRKVGGQRRLRERRGQIKALAHVEYRSLRSKRMKGKIYETVADAYKGGGVSSGNTVRQWDNKIRDEGLSGVLDAELDEARRDAAARVVRASDLSSSCGDGSFWHYPDGTVSYVPDEVDPYSDAALRRDGEEYARLVKSKKDEAPLRKVSRKSRNPRQDKMG